MNYMKISTNIKSKEITENTTVNSDIYGQHPLNWIQNM